MAQRFDVCNGDADGLCAALQWAWGDVAAFTSLAAGSGSLNLIAPATDRAWSWWGRVIFHVADVDAFHRHAVGQGLKPDFAPRDAEWGERYFHITDPDGHELSFARVFG